MNWKVQTSFRKVHLMMLLDKLGLHPSPTVALSEEDVFLDPEMAALYIIVSGQLLQLGTGPT